MKEETRLAYLLKPVPFTASQRFPTWKRNLKKMKSINVMEEIIKKAEQSSKKRK